MHLPHHERCTHVATGAANVVEVIVFVIVVVGLGSTQIRPNHSFEWQVVELEEAEEVIEGDAVSDIDVGSDQRLEVAVTTDVTVTVGAGAGVTESLLSVEVVDVVVIGSLQPNHPGVLQVEVDELEVEVDSVVVVVSSKQPHQPGVLQVAVRVLVDDVDETAVVVELELLLSKYSQLKQSVQSG